MSLDGLPLFESSRNQEKPAPARAEAPTPARPLSVSELTARIKGVLEPSFSSVWVRGEISNLRPAASGHVYFSLKDSDASISAAVFGWGRKRASFELREGLEVICNGRVSVYGPRGSYQMVVEKIEPLGAGALQVAFEQLKAKLSQEGLFSAARKRALPMYPRSVAVVTSPTGAAIRDVLSVLHRRAPHLRVTVLPALVQGDEAPPQLVRAIGLANDLKLGDVILLTRGGGSLEDLWAFNDERLARAVASSQLPVVSAVGHEIDFTISDFVADLRAPTPSAGAEILSAHWVQSAQFVQEARQRLVRPIRRALSVQRDRLGHLRARLVNPRDRLREQAQRCDELLLRLQVALGRRIERGNAALQGLSGKLDALSPLKVLERGYSLVRDAAEPSRVMKSSRDVRSGQRLRITFHDGDRQVEAI